MHARSRAHTHPCIPRAHTHTRPHVGLGGRDLISEVGDEGECKLCRCWKSESFPFCDGSHTAHNEACGDNAGPIVVKPPPSNI